MLDRGESDDNAKNSCSHFLALLIQSYSPEQISSNFHNDVFQVTEHDVLHNISEIVRLVNCIDDNFEMLVTVLVVFVINILYLLTLAWKLVLPISTCH